MNKLNKTLVIICLILVSSITISFSFISLNNNVYADSVDTNLVYTLDNVIVPIALNTSIDYKHFFNAYISFNIVVDIYKQEITFTNARLSYAYTILNENPSGFSTLIQRPRNDEIIDITGANGSSTLPISAYFSVTEYNTIARQDMRVYQSDNGYYSNTKLSFSKSPANITNIDRIVYSYYQGSHSGNEYGLYNFITYYDTNNNYISFGFPVFNIIQYGDNFPMLNKSYSQNLDLVSNLYKTYTIRYNYRAYYLNKLTNEQINNESYFKGYEEGKIEGDLNGYERGYDIGYNDGHSNGYDSGKRDGIASKGENVWSNSNEFIKNIFVGIFDILSIELLPNVSLGTFVVIPLIFSVLFFIVKVAKGGGD